jgi:hypothetical protein
VAGGGDGKKKKEMVGPTFGGGKWRASRNGGWEGEFGGVCKMETCLEALLEMDFCTKPPNFGVEAIWRPPLEMLLQALPLRTKTQEARDKNCVHQGYIMVALINLHL